MKLYPNWKANLVVFGSLILVLIGNFFWQVQRINKSFEDHSLEYSRVLAAVVELNIRNSMMSYNGMETIIGTFLENSARFINYLNLVEPFNSNELAAFANESGLAGIKIFENEKNENITGPEGWLEKPYNLKNNELKFFPEEHLYLFSFSEGNKIKSSLKIIVGMSSEEVEKIEKKMSLKTLLNILKQMDAIEYVRFSKSEELNDKSLKPPSLIWVNGNPVSETRIKIGERELIVGLEANYFSSRMERLRKELLVFVSFLVLFGSFSSWWLYRIQLQRLEQTRNFEREIGRQHEQASLGRASTTIIHEMRNPLNAISMGLQRLQIEADSLDDEQRNLVVSMREAVERSNSVLSNLQQYVRPFHLNIENIVISKLIENLIILYQSQFEKNKIDLQLNLDKKIKINGDLKYLSQVFENLIKNGIEAQISGGFFKITVSNNKNECQIIFENKCKNIKSEEINMVLEPYFTTKTYGTGLGLPISKKIVEAHNGILETELENEMFSVCITLPINPVLNKGEVEK